MLSATYLKQLDDAELVRISSHEVNDLTSTALEVELLARLEPLIGTDLRKVADDHSVDASYLNDFLEAISDFEVRPDHLRQVLDSHPATLSEKGELLALLNDHDIHTKDQLEKLIAFANEFRTLANDAGDVFERLSTFATNATEE